MISGTFGSSTCPGALNCVEQSNASNLVLSSALTQFKSLPSVGATLGVTTGGTEALAEADGLAEPVEVSPPTWAAVPAEAIRTGLNSSFALLLIS